MTTSTSTETSH